MEQSGLVLSPIVYVDRSDSDDSQKALPLPKSPLASTSQPQFVSDHSYWRKPLSGIGFLLGRRFDPVQKMARAELELAKLIATQPQMADIVNNETRQNELKALVVDLRSYGKLEWDQASLQAAAVHSLMYKGDLFGRQIDPGNRYLFREETLLPRDIEVCEENDGFLVHFKDQDKGRLKPSETEIYQRRRKYLHTLSLRVSSSGNDLVAQKTRKRKADEAQRSYDLERQPEIWNKRLKGVPFINPTLQFQRTPRSDGNIQESLVVGMNRGHADAFHLSRLSGLKLKDRWEFFAKTIEGIAGMHEQGVVHGNLHCHNIWIHKLRDNENSVVYEPRICSYGTAGALRLNDDGPEFVRPRRLHTKLLPPEINTQNYKAMDLEAYKAVDVWQLGLLGLCSFAKASHKWKNMFNKQTREIRWQYVKWSKHAPEKVEEIRNVLKAMLSPVVQRAPVVMTDSDSEEHLDVPATSVMETDPSKLPRITAAEALQRMRSILATM